MPTRTKEIPIENLTQIAPTLNGTICPHCKSTNNKKNGKASKNQRHRCRTCGKYFSDTSKSALYRLKKKHLVEKYIQCMKDGMTLRATAKETGISLATSFAWRHRFLRNIPKDRNQLGKTVTILAFPLPYSQKGARIKSKDQGKQTSIIAFDKEGKLQIQCIEGKAKTIKTQIVIDEISSKANNIRYLKSKILTQTLKQSPKSASIKKRKETNHAQNEINKIRDWLAAFKGVASKYMQNYWNWYALIHQIAIPKVVDIPAFEKTLLRN